MRYRLVLVILSIGAWASVTQAQIPFSWEDKWTGHLKDRPILVCMQNLALRANPFLSLYVLDSTVTYEADSIGAMLVTSSAETFDYDEFIRFNCQASYTYSSTTSQMLPSVKDSVIFRGDGRIDTIYTYYGNVVNKVIYDWWLGAYEVYEYKGDTQQVTAYAGDPLNGYQLINRTIYIYYPDGNLKELIYYEVDSMGTLMPQTKREYLRTNGLLTQDIGYFFYPPWASWVYSDRVEYFYMGNLNHLTFYYGYDPGNMQWQNSAKELNFYDAQGRLIERQRYTWEPSLGNYVASNSYTQSYTALGDPDTLIQYVSYDGSSFVPMARFVYVYDGANNPSLYLSWWYNLVGFEWIPVEKQEIEYNQSLAMEELLWPPFIDSMYMRHQPLKVDNYSWDNGVWRLYRSKEIFYTHRNFTSNKTMPIDHGVKVYPNPVGETIGLSGEGSGYFELSDLAGQRVLFTPLRLPAEVSVQWLPAGVYVYKLFVQGQTYCGKLIKK